MNWNDNANNEAGFEIWRYGPISINGVPLVYNGLPPVTIIGAAAGGGIGTQTGAPINPAQPTTGLNTYIDTTGLQPTACYNYQVRAVTNNVDVSTWAIAPSAGCTIAAVPTLNLNATPAGYRVDLAWTSNATGVVNFRVTRTLPLPQTPVLLPGTDSVYADTTVLPSTTYTYQVEAIGAGNIVLATANTTATTLAVPLSPTTLTTTPTSTQITVSWTDNANNEDGFVLERAVVINGTAGQYQQIPGVGTFLPPNAAGGLTSYVDTSALPNVVYQYRVKAILLVNGDSGYATGIPVSLIGVVLAAPTNLQATVIGTSVALNWGDASTGETGYVVQRATVSITNAGVVTTGAFATITTPTGNRPANAINVTNTAVPNGIYVYKVYAVSGATLGPVAQTAPLYRNTAMTLPTQPLVSNAANRTTNSINVRWTASSPTTNAITGYVVQRCDSGVSYGNILTGTTSPNALTQGAASLVCALAGNWTTVTATTGGRAGVSYNNTGLAGKRLYGYRIIATNTLTGTSSGASQSRILWTN